jgi:hypothetical protein
LPTPSYHGQFDGRGGLDAGHFGHSSIPGANVKSLFP